MTSDSVQAFRQPDSKQKETCKLINRGDYSHEREKLIQNIGEGKPTRKFKTTKKFTDCKKSFKDTKIEDVFLNSEYFKHQTNNNMSSVSFCSGDNGELRWTLDSNFEMSANQKNFKNYSYSEGRKLAVIDKNEKGFLANSQFNLMKTYGTNNSTAIKAKESSMSSHLPEKMKYSNNSLPKELSEEKPEKFIEGVLTGKGRIDRDLVSLITEQMFLAERELQITRSHLIETISKLNERDLEIIQLHEKLKLLQKLDKKSSKNESSDIPNKTSEDYQRLILASEKLKKQVKDMEEFLNDYGLVWIGDRETNSKPDFDKIIKNFQRLNSIACQPKIIQTTLGAKFELPREISVVLYSNGILLRGNDFREYSKVATNMFLQDVEDGYFPSELQAEFPEGVPFEVTDKRNEAYEVTPGIEVFKGNGNRLGSSFEDKPASVVFLEPVKESKSHAFATTAGHNYESVDKPHVKRIQKKRSRSQQDDLYYCYSRHSCDRNSSENSIPDSKDVGKLITLKIRFGKSQTESFVLQMNENDKLSKFHDALQQTLNEKYQTDGLASKSKMSVSQPDFEVHAYGKNPFRLIDNLQKRLRDYGIRQNCVLNVWEI